MLRRYLRGVRNPGTPNGGRGADLGHFCWHLDALLPSVALERMTIEHLMPVQAAAAAGVRQ